MKTFTAQAIALESSEKEIRRRELYEARSKAIKEEREAEVRLVLHKITAFNK